MNQNGGALSKIQTYFCTPYTVILFIMSKFIHRIFLAVMPASIQGKINP